MPTACVCSGSRLPFFQGLEDYTAFLNHVKDFLMSNSISNLKKFLSGAFATARKPDLSM
jgi:hypothetical protein